VPQLISDILGLARKPPNGPLPLVATKPDGHGLSKAAYTFAEWLIPQSENGLSGDPKVDVKMGVPSELLLTKDDFEDAIEELKSQNCVGERSAFGMREIYAKPELFARYDHKFSAFNPEHDARVIAAKLMSESLCGSMLAQVLAEEFDWAPRRINPAITWLVMRGLLDSRSQEMGGYPFIRRFLKTNAETRRFLKSFGLAHEKQTNL